MKKITKTMLSIAICFMIAFSAFAFSACSLGDVEPLNATISEQKTKIEELEAEIETLTTEKNEKESENNSLKASNTQKDGAIEELEAEKDSATALAVLGRASSILAHEYASSYGFNFRSLVAKIDDIFEDPIVSGTGFKSTAQDSWLYLDPAIANDNYFHMSDTSWSMTYLDSGNLFSGLTFADMLNSAVVSVYSASTPRLDQTGVKLESGKLIIFDEQFYSDRFSCPTTHYDEKMEIDVYFDDNLNITEIDYFRYALTSTTKTGESGVAQPRTVRYEEMRVTNSSCTYVQCGYSQDNEGNIVYETNNYPYAIKLSTAAGSNNVSRELYSAKYYENNEVVDGGQSSNMHSADALIGQIHTFAEFENKIYLKGDIVKDDEFNFDDFEALMQYLAGEQTLTPSQLNAADVDMNGEVNALDLNALAVLAKEDVSNIAGTYKGYAGFYVDEETGEYCLLMTEDLPEGPIHPGDLNGVTTLTQTQKDITNWVQNADDFVINQNGEGISYLAGEADDITWATFEGVLELYDVYGFGTDGASFYILGDYLVWRAGHVNASSASSGDLILILKKVA